MLSVGEDEDGVSLLRIVLYIALSMFFNHSIALIIASWHSLLLTFPFFYSTRVQLTGVNSKTCEC